MDKNIFNEFVYKMQFCLFKILYKLCTRKKLYISSFFKFTMYVCMYIYIYTNVNCFFKLFLLLLTEIKTNELEKKADSVKDVATEDLPSFESSAEKDIKEDQIGALPPESTTSSKGSELKVEIKTEGSVNEESHNEESVKAESIKSESLKSESIKSENVKDGSIKDESLNEEPELTIALPEPELTIPQDSGELSGNSNFLAEWNGSMKFNGGFKKDHQSSSLLSIEPQKKNIVKSSDMYVWNW